MTQPIPVTITKVFPDLPFAHRQHTHAGHCRLLHGHNWAFEITFAADVLDANQFVIDFGELKWCRAWLEERFDHTTVLNEDDPWLDHLRFQLVDVTSVTHAPGLCTDLAKIVVVPNCGAEGLARYVLHHLNELLRASPTHSHRNVRVTSVRVHEDSKNSATATLSSVVK